MRISDSICSVPHRARRAGDLDHAALVGWSSLALALALWLPLTRGGRQAASVTRVGISTLRQRLGSSSVIVIGIAGVVGVLVALLAMGEGFSATLQSTGSDDTAIVLRGASRVRSEFGA